MSDLSSALRRAAAGSATVLIRGESGTGKELAARAVHEASPRAAKPLVKIDCASLPEQLLESELFGYERGAFTGAAARKQGRVELAQQGTLFLDEIGELTLPLQAKLLRLLQDRELQRLGSTETLRVDVRVVAATHRDLEEMVASQQFRADLFYRLNVVPLWLPPLRERRSDVAALAQSFCRELGAENGRPDARLDAEALALLEEQPWPGNVRQLRNVVERLVVLSRQALIGVHDVREALSAQACFRARSHAAPRSEAEACPVTPIMPLEQQLRIAERRALEHALMAAKHNRSLAARLLRISRTQLYVKLADHGLGRDLAPAAAASNAG